MRRELEAIHKFLTSHRKDVADNALWRRITEITETGTTVGKRIKFTPRDLERLRQHVIREGGVDPTLGGLPRDRAIQADRTSDEKLALGGVFESLILFTRPEGGPIPVKGNPTIPSGSFLSVNAMELLEPNDVSDTVVVMENGRSLLSAPDIKWPEELGNPLVVYKGHGSSQKQLMEWLQGFPRERIVAYFDFDPAGLMMAIRYPAGKLLIPEQWNTLNQNDPGNKLKEFHVQSVSVSQLREANQLPVDLRLHVIDNKLALTQEYMTAKRFGLELLSII